MEYPLLNDEQFLEAVASGRIERFGHRDHLRLAFLAAREHAALGDVVERCRDGIRSVAAAKGAPDRYDETRTAAWAACVRHAASSMPRASFDEVLEAHPELENPGHLDRVDTRQR